MSPLTAIADHWAALLVWGLVASAAMATLLEGAQFLGFSRMSLPFLFGAFVSGDRRSAIVIGYVLYLVGALLFAILYALCLQTLGMATAWSAGLVGLLIGLGHGLFLVTVFLPLLPYIHPRLATDYDGPGALGLIEPPGAFGLNYGRTTPLTTIAAQALYGLIFGIGYGAAVAVT